MALAACVDGGRGVGDAARGVGSQLNRKLRRLPFKNVLILTRQFRVACVHCLCVRPVCVCALCVCLVCVPCVCAMFCCAVPDDGIYSQSFDCGE